ncbi:MAG TPA: efflux RND transporter permease subunit [Balneolales bacterium]|nr:efflux RND transporter permease subunit [Balneolales bacterium]
MESRGILSRIVRFSLKYKGIIIALATVLVLYGAYLLTRVRYKIFPDFAPPEVVIQTEAQGLSPVQVEQLVTQPIENVLNGSRDLKSMRSGSIQGISVITLTFRDNSDIYRDRQIIAERLSTVASSLPQEVKAPVMTPLTSTMRRILVIGLTSPDKSGRSLMKLRTIAQWTIKPQLLAVPGVASVPVFGKEVEELQIQLKPDAMYRYHISLGEIVAAAREATGVRGAGFIDTGNQQVTLKVSGQSATPDEIEHTVIRHDNGENVTLGDVADVRIGYAPPAGSATINGKDGVILNVVSQYGANTIEVTHRVEKALKSLEPGLKAQHVELYSHLFRPANFIQTAIHNLDTDLLLGGLLVIIVLSLFLFNLRTAAISCAAIPISLLTAIIILDKFGLSLNTMTLGGLAIAIGEVVDDAVIDVENILRRLLENRHAERPRPAVKVVFDASLEVRSAVVYATFTVILVFLPILSISGVAGKLFAPLGIAYILAILASLLVAVTLTPALSLILLQTKKITRAEPPLVMWLKRKYISLLRVVEHYPRLIMAGVVCLIIVGLAVLPFLNEQFLPELREGHYVVEMNLLPGSSITQSEALGRRVGRALLKLPYVRAFAQKIGQTREAEDINGPHQSEIDLDLKPIPKGEYDRAQNAIRNTLSKFTGATFTLETFLTERIDETLSGYTAAVVVNIFGNNLKVLGEKVTQIRDLLNRLPDARDVRIQSPPSTPHLVIRLRKKALERWGFTPVEVMNKFGIFYKGLTVGQVYKGNRTIDVTMILNNKLRKSLSAVGSLPLMSPTGAFIKVDQLADIYEASGPYSILHEGARRVQVVTCNVAGGNASAFVSRAQKEIHSKIRFPAGTYVTFTGTAEAQAQSRRDLLMYSLIALTGIIIILSVVMRHYRNLLLIILNLPFALVGGVLAAWMTGGSLSLGSMVGFVTLFGITLRNGIMMISHFQHLVNVEGHSWNFDTAIKGASERLAPILMTALVTGLGLLPLALGSGAAGREIEGPMAVVILGGLITSTVLNLLVLPTLSLRYGRFENLLAEDALGEGSEKK